MGQRSQTYIRIKNPMKQPEYVDMLNDDEVKIGNKIFGKKNASIIPFHHQWLYGMSFVGIAHRILDEATKNSSNAYHPFSVSPSYNKANYCSDHISSELATYTTNTKIRQTINLINHIIGFQGNREIAEVTGRYGVERFLYIGDNHLKSNGTKYRGAVANSEDCTMGDNNDGILIVDTIEKKYAFVNIFTFDYGTDDDLSDIYTLSPMQPYSAKEYARAYYPAKDHLDKVLLAKDLMKYYQVLTKKELIKIFPKSFK